MKAYKHKKKVNCIRKKQDKKIVTLIRQMSNYFGSMINPVDRFL